MNEEEERENGKNDMVEMGGFMHFLGCLDKMAELLAAGTGGSGCEMMNI